MCARTKGYSRSVDLLVDESVLLRADTRAGREARAFVDQHVRRGVPEETFHDGLLVVTEIVNAVVDSPAKIGRVLRLRVECGAGRLRLSVEDGPIDAEQWNQGSAPTRAQLLNALTSSWGVENRAAPVAWAELTAP